MFSFNRTNRTHRAAVGFAIAASALTLPLALTGCANSAPVTETPAGTHQTEGAITIADAWAKATSPDASLEEAMSGVFGTLENTGTTDLTITGLSSDAADMVELHEVVDGQMRKIEGDVTIAAGKSLLLEPGANHIMLMDLKSELLPGDEVPITLTFSDGSTLKFVALVKDTSGANESYDDIGHDAGTDSDAESHDGH